MSSSGSSPLFFVHIPKTAGTSFRKGSEFYFGVESVRYDYGDHSAETSSLVHEHIYQQTDIWAFAQALCHTDVRMLAGHVPAVKYLASLGVRNTLTFLREPLQRIVSEYQHFVRHNGFVGTFEDFYRKPQFINRLGKMVHNTPLEALAFVGLTECYDESLQMINARFSLAIPDLQLNMGRQDISKSHMMTGTQRMELEHLNSDDIKLYQHAVRLFEERLSLARRELSYVHGLVQQASVKSVTGWAWWANNDEPVELNVMVNDEFVGLARAVDLRPGLLRLGLPRGGYVGFHLDYSAQEGDEIRCEVVQTGQVISQTIVKSKIVS